MMVSRRRARIAALIALYEWELGGSPVDDAIEAAIAEANLLPDLAAYTRRVVLGVIEHLEALDGALSNLIRDFDYKRTAAVDRNMMRIAAYELFHEPGIPPAVSINEALEIVKRFSTAESSRFVNGVLGRLLHDTPKANWDPSEAPEAESPAPPEPEPEVEETELDEAEAKRIGAWRLRQ